MTNASDDIHKIKVNAIERLLQLIDGVNQGLSNSKSINNPLVIKQYEHLKKDYTQQLLKLLEDYELLIHLDEAA